MSINDKTHTINRRLSIEEQTYVYVLLLEEGRYYVGLSKIPADRIASHLQSNGSTWTKKYAPIRVIETQEGDAFDEDKLTKQYMLNYGIDNVRGASYSQVTLSVEQIASIRREFESIKGICFNCHKTGHFISDCREDKSSQQSLPPLRCKRCGRDGHSIVDCYASRHINGNFLYDYCVRCGRDTHTQATCYARWHVDGDEISM